MEAHTDNVRCQLREALAARAEIIFAYLHGSFAEGLPFHDVDVAVYLDPALAMATDIFDYEMSISVELTRTLRFLVDVHVLNGAPLGFQHSVLQGEALLVRDEDELTDFIERVGLEYMDFAYLGRRYLLEVLR
ncbi:MAG: nucleotidyltransferase domain-containing protein [Anaerolineae bacterium]|nr:nucleotidyltransferase domain-containing protein [Anaerolineae bacterium]